MQDVFNFFLVSSTYFKLDRDLVSPRDSSIASFDPDHGLSEVLMQAPSDDGFSTSVEHI